MLDSVKDFIGDKTAGAASAVGSNIEKIVNDMFGEKWHSFTHGVLLKLVIVIIVIVLITTVFDSVRRIIRGLDVAAIGGLFYYLGCKVPDVVLLRELIKPLKTLGLILFGVGVALFIVFKLLGALSKKGRIGLKAAMSGGGSKKPSASEAAASAGDVITDKVPTAADPKKGKSALPVILTAVIALAAGFGGGSLYTQNMETKTAGSYDFDVISQQITEISELSTMENRYKAEVPYTSENKKLWKTNIDIPLTKKSMVVDYSGTLKMGPDLAGFSQNDITYDEGTSTLTIRIPHSKVLSHEIDEDSWIIKDKKNGLFNFLTPEDDSELRKYAKKKALKTVDVDKLLADADQKAQEQIKKFLGLAYKDITIEVVSE